MIGLVIPTSVLSRVATANDLESGSPGILGSAANGMSVGRSVFPSGWRRTNHGWERAEVWLREPAATPFPAIVRDDYRPRFAAVGGIQPQSLSQWITWDEAREPGWANRVMLAGRQIHPVFWAAFLVSVASLLAHLSELSQPRRPDTKYP